MKASERAIAPADEKDWVVVECLSNGSCVYEHKLTKERRVRDAKKGGGDAIPAVLPFEDTQKSFSESDDGLTAEERAFLRDSAVQSHADLREKIRLSKLIGRDYLILQVGNLEGCAPCQEIDTAIKESPLAKDKGVGVYDTNYLTLKDERLRLMFQQMNLANDFPFPHVFVLQLDKAKPSFTQYLEFGRGEANVQALREGIEKMRKAKSTPASSS